MLALPEPRKNLSPRNDSGPVKKATEKAPSVGQGRFARLAAQRCSEATRKLPRRAIYAALKLHILLVTPYFLTIMTNYVERSREQSSYSACASF